MTTEGFGNDISWSLGTCTSSQAYESYTEYVEQCCLGDGVFTLKCINPVGDGWYSGFIEIQGNQYCGDFSLSDGHEKAIPITIVNSGKYLLFFLNRIRVFC